MTFLVPLLFILTVLVGNFALGFGLAIYLGQGPDIRRWQQRKAAATSSPASDTPPAS